MSDLERLARAEEVIHERARMLAAESVDSPLAPADAKWLASHLKSCPDCAAVAEEHLAIRHELASMPVPEPPRDLWARTSAALDAAEKKAGSPSASRSGAARASRQPVLSTSIAMAFVLVVAVASILVYRPAGSPSGSRNPSNIAFGSPGRSGQSSVPQGPLAVIQGKSIWIASTAGVYEIKGGTSTCTASDGSCTTANVTQTLGTIRSNSAVSAAIAPDASRAAVWTRGKIAVLPLAASSVPVSLDQLTPRPTTAATPAATQTPPPTDTPAPIESPSSEGTAEATPVVTPAATPTASPAPMTEPIAILSGYEIVGPDPEFSPDGTMLAFSARPVDHGTGPDVFVWRVGQDLAEPVTFRHDDLFAGWFGGRILISEFTVASEAQTATYTSYVFYPGTGAAFQIDLDMLMPVVDPTGRFLVYWSGTVRFDSASGLWKPASGDLYFDSWSNISLTPASLGPVVGPTESPNPTPSEAAPGETPTPTPVPDALATDGQSTVAVDGTARQLLPVSSGSGSVRDWSVRWDGSGQHVAIWAADAVDASIGRLSLFSIDSVSGLIDVDHPLLAVDRVMAGVAFYDGHLMYASAVDGKTYQQAIPTMPLPSPPESTPTPVVSPTDTAASESPAA
jgi:hypothetical protein